MHSCAVGVGGVNPIGDRDISEKTCRKKASTQVWRGGSPVLARRGRGLLDCRVTQLPPTLLPLLLYEQLRCLQLVIRELHPSSSPPKIIYSFSSITSNVDWRSTRERRVLHHTVNGLKLLLRKIPQVLCRKILFFTDPLWACCHQKEQGWASRAGTSPPKHTPLTNFWAKPKGPQSKRT